MTVVKPGAHFLLPGVSTRLPLAVYPDSAAIERECGAWARPYLVDYFGGERLADRYIRQRMPYWACVCYPHMKADRAFILPNIMIPAGIGDDSFSKPGIQEDITAVTALRDRWNAVLDDVRPGPEFPAGRMLYDALEQAWPQMPRPLADRYRQCYREIFDSARDEARARHSAGVPDHVTYMRQRLINLFGYWATIQTEYAIGVDMTGPLTEDHHLARARDLVIEHMILVNDLYSFPKEMDAGEAMNSIRVFMDRQGLSLQEAVDRLGHLITATEDQFICVRDGIASRATGDVRSYVAELGHLISGNLHYHRLTTRYHGDGHTGAEVISGRVTLRPRPTVHDDSA